MKLAKIPLVILCVALLLALSACGILATPRSAPEEKPVEQSSPPAEDETPDSTKPDSENSGNEFVDSLETHKLPLKGNPLVGSYVTTSGVLLDIEEDGSYSWDEREVGGDLLTGTYEIYEGTPKSKDDGSLEYVLESETGPVYTLIITFDTDIQTIQVFDTYKDDVYRVTDLVNNIWFEAAVR